MRLQLALTKGGKFILQQSPADPAIIRIICTEYPNYLGVYIHETGQFKFRKWKTYISVEDMQELITSCANLSDHLKTEKK